MDDAMTIVVFEDPQCEMLAPITLARLAATITCGSFRLVDLLSLLDDELFGVSRPHLQSIQRIDYPLLQTLEQNNSTDVPHDRSIQILLNARVAPTAKNFETMRSLKLRASQSAPDAPPTVIMDRNTVAAVLNPRWSLHDIFASGYLGTEEWLEKAKQLEPSDAKLQTIEMPHELIACNMECFRSNMELRLSLASKEQSIVSPLREVSDGLFLADGATIGDYVLSDTRKGPIIVDRGAEVGPYTLLRGPIYIGPKAKILEHAAIKDAVSLSHTTKTGGEVEASIVEPYSNKQHHGFLGHSYLGSWINLGAGTCNSDLKNTYGTVNMEYGFGKAQTNMQFLGCIMGDYSKDRDQHWNLHRENYRCLQHDVRFCDQQRAELRELRSTVRTTSEPSTRGNGQYTTTHVCTPKRPATWLRCATDLRHASIDPNGTRSPRRRAGAVVGHARIPSLAF
jgi:UDP-N-acetylglucosamine diphosphorylase / glucose-1-phosphate thymidylyltransferase / UDP-N-acetylgalactosamine diphosphorylase / glucosamine-1-phosphate N-acetyltransferase / galactosamine-1-phosphate N-acetyltransferase